MLHFQIITLFPEFFISPLQTSLLGRAREAGLIKFTFINPRDFSQRPHRNVDDRPFGGGPGMLMQLEPILLALQSLSEHGPILQMSPAGKMFDARWAKDLSENRVISLICGRYEGIDSRIANFYPVEELSLCKAVLNGGETAALAVIEAVCRFLPGFLGKDESNESETFTDGLLEYPQYTRPEDYDGYKVPQVLLEGNHALIAEWRRRASLKKTLFQQPALLNEAKLDKKDVETLQNFTRRRIGRNLSFCLCHFPVHLEKGRIGSSSLTNLDVHDISRISRSYGMGPFFVLLAMQEQLDILEDILRHWRNAANPESHADRKKALELICPVRNFTELEAKAYEYFGCKAQFIASSAAWPDKKSSIPLLSPEELRSLCEKGPAIILLGTARGLDLKSLPFSFQLLRPLRFLDENHLSVRAAAAIMADRILGDFY